MIQRVPSQVDGTVTTFILLVGLSSLRHACGTLGSFQLDVWSLGSFHLFQPFPSNPSGGAAERQDAEGASGDLSGAGAPEAPFAPAGWLQDALNRRQAAPPAPRTLSEAVYNEMAQEERRDPDGV